MQKKLSFWIKDEDLRQLQEIGQREDRSLGYLIRKAVRVFLGGKNGG